MQSYISTSTAALLTGEDRRRVFEKITDGVYETRKQSGGRGGNGGESYQIAVSSLPVEAQIIYAQRGGVINGPINDDCDLAGYHARFGDNGMRELLGKLDVETFVLDLDCCASRIRLDGFRWQLVNETSIEVEIGKSQGLNPLFSALTAQQIKVLSMRNKANRLEELFVKLVEEGRQ